MIGRVNVSYGLRAYECSPSRAPCELFVLSEETEENKKIIECQDTKEIAMKHLKMCITISICKRIRNGSEEK